MQTKRNSKRQRALIRIYDTKQAIRRRRYNDIPAFLQKAGAAIKQGAINLGKELKAYTHVDMALRDIIAIAGKMQIASQNHDTMTLEVGQKNIARSVQALSSAIREVKSIRR